MTECYTCTIPALPPSLNVWKHMGIGQSTRLKNEWKEMLWAVLNEAGNKCPRGLDFVDLQAVLFFKENRRRDADNFEAALWKWTKDGLVDEGVIPDDTPEHCRTHNPVMTPGAETESTLLIVEYESKGV